jgi:ATP phosphoribosyltransferase regulatory subunit HisZ
MARPGYPTGVRPLLIEETARRRRTEARIVSALESAGYAEVVLPILDYADPEADARQSYRFVDRDGDLVAIRSDFTPMVARALAPSIGAADLPLRLFYRGDVIRYEPSRLGTNREMFQIGAEIIGDASTAADIEILTMAAALLRQFEAKPLIVYTDARIAAAPRFAHIELADIDPEVASRLAAIAGAVPAECSLHLDDVDAARGYYTALRFRAYDTRTRKVVAQGGRYDSLYERFGTPAPAVGFTLTIDELELA